MTHPGESRPIEAQESPVRDPGRPRFKQRAKTWVTTRIGIDTRALAAMRICLALIILVDLFYRATNIGVFYTDAGVWPRSSISGSQPGGWFALHSISGALWFQVLLFTVHAAVTVLLLVGYRTRVATILSFLLLLSLHNRNLLILNAGDIILRVLLFWSMFLPLGERWSIDAWKRTVPRRFIAEVASFALLLQIVIIYVLNAYHKSQSGAWEGGRALLYVFRNEGFMSPLGLWMTNYPEVLSTLGSGWYWLLVAAPLLILTTGWLRAIVAAMFVGGHFSMFLAMKIGVFPLISMAAVLVFLPPRLWDVVEQRTRAIAALPVFQPRRRPQTTLLSLFGLLGGGRLPERAAKWTRALKRPATGVKHYIATLFLIWIVVSAGMTAGVVSLPDEVRDSVPLQQRDWKMFANPPKQNVWVIAPAILESGHRIDAIHLDETDWDEPRYHDGLYPDHRWRKYYDVILHPNREHHRTLYAAYLCEQWNAENDDPMIALVLFRVSQGMNLEGPDPPPTRHQLTHYRCES